MQNGFESQILIEPVARLMEEFSRLPGVGPKTASRLVFFLLRAPDEQAHALAEALANLKDNVRFCSRCFNITVSDPCLICSSSSRDQRLICVVEEPLDVLAIERTSRWRGVYHVLHGRIAPLEGMNREDIRFDELIDRGHTAGARPPNRRRSRMGRCGHTRISTGRTARAVETRYIASLQPLAI